MDSKQDYFRSPTPRNIQNFYSPFRLVRQQQDPLSITHLLSPFNRITNNYCSQFSPYQPIKEEDENINSSKKQVYQIKPITGLLRFQNQQQQISQQIATPQKNAVSIAQIQTTSRKKYDLRSIQSNNQKNIFGRDTQRGLRALSRQAYQIFQHSSSMTYQQVAQRIIEHNQEVNQFPEKKKERQSIKRRIYDALNVLIAVGLLEKTGKKISLNKKVKEQHYKQEDTKKSVTQKLQQKVKLLQRKKKHLQNIKNQQKCLLKLVNRNMSVKQSSKNQLQKISFPFVLARQFSVIKNQNQAKINGFLCADVDAIKKLKI